MVRLKQRYLLLNILYPDQTTGPASSPSIPSYLKFHVPGPTHIGPQDFVRLLRTQIAHLFGDHGMGVSASSLKIIYFSQATSTVLLRVPRTYFRLAWAALTFIHELPPPNDETRHVTRCAIRVVRVSGTIKKAEEELLRRSRRDIVRAKMAEDGRATNLLDRFSNPNNQTSALPAVEESKDVQEVVDEDMSESD